MNTTETKPMIFNAESLTKYDKGSVIVYFLISIFILKISALIRDTKIQKVIVLMYSLLTPLLLYAFSYKSLRNIKMFIIWIGFGLFHLFLYNQLIDNTELMFKTKHAAYGLQFTIYFVVLFEIIRITHLRLLNYELVSLGGYGATRDLWENRRIKLPDTVCFFSYFILWVIVSMII